MNYKTYLQNNETISIRLRIIKHRVVDKEAINHIATRYNMHRNTIRNIMNLYESRAPSEFKEKIETNISLSSNEIQSLGSFLVHGSRKPKSHPHQATPLQEQKIITSFEKLGIGCKRLHLTLKRRKELGNLTLAKIRGVYKRKGFTVRKVRTKNGETRSLYNYQTIGSFEDGHYDTKVLADAHSLPEHIYENLKQNKHLPLYEWNIIFVGCRARFTAYSRGKSSTFGLQFLVLVLSHLRSYGVTGKIHMHTDGGSEFFSNSEGKKQEWNGILGELDADIDCYNPNWDIRKNLIERSHRSDDEEFLIPFGDDMKSNYQFMKHAQEYNDYWNKRRAHSGAGMDGKTPKEKLLSHGFHQVDRILDFEVLYLDANFYLLQQHLEYFFFQKKLRKTNLEKLKIDRKISIDLVTQYSHLKVYAQNVLTYYLFLF